MVMTLRVRVRMPSRRCHSPRHSPRHSPGTIGPSFVITHRPPLSRFHSHRQGIFPSSPPRPRPPPPSSSKYPYPDAVSNTLPTFPPLLSPLPLPSQSPLPTPFPSSSFLLRILLILTLHLYLYVCFVLALALVLALVVRAYSAPTPSVQTRQVGSKRTRARPHWLRSVPV